MDIIEFIKNEVEEKCLGDNNVFGYGIWTHHIVSVVKNAKILANEIGANVEIVEIASLLHDYAGIKDYSKHAEHHIYGAKEAEMILGRLNYPKDKIEKVKDCILSHRGSIQIDKKSKEAICVANADAIAHIENVPSLLYFAYCKKGLEIDEGTEWVSKKIKRSWDKLSNEGKIFIRDKYESVQNTLNLGQK
ncbi:HD domain-containing protein [Sporosalibacterium faouarense]|uniref:HD domain-containing protein n=1 Tax=Sporosalibacterium faouarense TaxID=516123 RepID=UPI00141D2A52|nr:HD domain-containing protein [Sporosalibacterium faouarense]MTI48937.1 HD domain-containing protein [Bacillota bacterium]